MPDATKNWLILLVGVLAVVIRGRRLATAPVAERHHHQ